MDLRGEERAQSIQIGAVLLFGVLILSFTTYQAFVVPQQNAQVEAEHQQVIDRQMQDIRNAIISLPNTRTGRGVTLTLGTSYPARAIALNPSPPTGTIRTAGTVDNSINLTLANARATDDETGDYWDGTNRSYNNGGLAYRPNYNEYENPPTIVYENTLLYKEFRTGNLTVTGQRLIDGSQLSLVTLNGSVNRGAAESVSLDVEAVSASDRDVTVTNETGENVTISFATQRGVSSWRDVLDEDEQYTDQGGHVVRGGVTETTVPDQDFNVVNIELEQGVQYDLRMAKAGIGTQVTDEDASYLTDISGDGASIEQGETQELVLEVRDAYNNPVTGVEVFGTPEEGSLDNTSKQTGSDGRVTFEYDSTGASVDTHSVDFSINSTPGGSFDPATPENVTMSVTVQSSGSGGGSAYTVNWADPSTLSANSGADLTACSSASCTWDIGDSNDTLLRLNSSLQPRYDGIGIEYAVSNSTVGTLTTTTATTDSTGSATTDLNASENGTVDVIASANEDSDTIEVIVENITSSGSAVDFPRVVYVERTESTLRGIDADGDIEDYAPSQSDVAALGQPNLDFDGDGNKEVPYVDSNSEIKVVDTAGNIETLDGTQNAKQNRIGIGDWNDDSTNEVVYVRSGFLYSVDPSGNETRLCYQACGGSNPRYYNAQSVAGVADFDGDNNKDVIYVDDNDEIAYFDQETDGPTSTSITVSNPDAVSRPVNFDGDTGSDSIEVAYVDTNGDFSLVDVNGNDGTQSTTYDVRSDAISGLDWTGDGVSDIIHVDSNNGEMRYFDVINGTSGTVTESGGQTPEPEDGAGIG